MDNTTFNRWLFQAYFDWCIESTGVCHVIIRGECVEHITLKKYISENNTLVLNIGGNAVRDLVIDHEGFGCRMSFGGIIVGVSFGYEEMVGVISPLGVILPFNIIPCVLDHGPGIMVLTKIGADPEPAQEETPGKESKSTVVDITSRFRGNKPADTP